MNKNLCLLLFQYFHSWTSNLTTETKVSPTTELNVSGEYVRVAVETVHSNHRLSWYVCLPVNKFIKSKSTENMLDSLSLCWVPNVQRSPRIPTTSPKIAVSYTNKFSLLWGEAQLCLPYDCL